MAVLLVFPGNPCGRDMLVRTLWRGRPPANPAAAVQTCLCRARAALGEEAASWLRTLDDGALLADPGEQDLDLSRFLQLHSSALQLLRSGYLDSASEALEQALACWRDPPLGDLPDAPEVAARRTELLEQRRLAWLTLADVLLTLGEQERILPGLAESVVDDPLDEHVLARLMLALYQSGRGGEALTYYDQARAEIIRILGAEPGAELRRLRDRLLTGQSVIIPRQWPSRTGITTRMPVPVAAMSGG